MNDTRSGAQNFVRSRDRTSFVVLPMMRRTPISFFRCLMKNSDIPMKPRMEMRTATPVNMLTILIVFFSSFNEALMLSSTLCSFQSRSSVVPSTSLIRSQSFFLCIPASSVLGQLNYTKSWDKSLLCYRIQSKQFFNWSTKQASKQSTVQQANTTTNSLYTFQSFYQEQNGTGSISFQLSGTSEEIMKTATVNRTGNTVSISLPKSSYLLANKSFERFGEIIQKMDVTNSETTVTITFTCYNTADYSYIIHNKTLEINILRAYQAGDGSVTNYSLSIPRPANVHINQVLLE